MDSKLKELDDEVYSKVLNYCNLAEGLVDEEKYLEAIKYFEKAFELLPNPKTDWDAGSWIWAAIGDCYFSLKEYENAVISFRHGEIYPDNSESGFMQLRIGQCYFELEVLEKAKEYLLRAYLLGDVEIFDEEDEKYKDFIKKLIEK